MNDIETLQKDNEALRGEIAELRRQVDALDTDVLCLKSRLFGTPLSRPDQPKPLVVGVREEPPAPQPPRKPKPKSKLALRRERALATLRVPEPPEPAPIEKGPSLMERRKAEHEARMSKIYDDKDRTKLVVRDIKDLAAKGLVVVLSESDEFSQVVTSKLSAGLTVAVLTSETPDDIRGGILSYAHAGDLQVLITTRAIFEKCLIEPKRIDVIYLASPVKMTIPLSDVLFRWLRPQPTKHRLIKLLGRPDTNIDSLRTSIANRFRDSR